MKRISKIKLFPGFNELNISEMKSLRGGSGWGSNVDYNCECKIQDGNDNITHSETKTCKSDEFGNLTMYDCCGFDKDTVSGYPTMACSKI